MFSKYEIKARIFPAFITMLPFVILSHFYLYQKIPKLIDSIFATKFLGDVSIPDSVSERVAFGPAVGMALSSISRTPNLIFTYREKDKFESITRINRAIFVVFLFVIAICTGVFYWQGKEVEKRRIKIAGLEQELEKYSPRLNQDIILQWAGMANKKSSSI